MLKIIPTSNRPTHHSKGDCVLNAMSIAYNKPYKEVFNDFKEFNEFNERQNYACRYNMVRLISKYGYEQYMQDFELDFPSLKQFAMTYSKGTYLVNITWGKYSDDHMTVIIDGDLYDLEGATDCWKAKIVDAWKIR